MIEELKALLLADPGVAALVGPRVYWNVRDERAPLPAIVLRLITTTPAYTYQDEDKLTPALVQADCGATDYGQAVAVGRAVKAVLAGYRGGIFQGVFLEAERGNHDPDQPAAKDWVSLDWRVLADSV